MTTVEPTIAVSPVVQELLEGALEKNSIDEAVRHIYDNMFQTTGWKYNASVTTRIGLLLIKGEADSGMCETYRNAFREILKIYDKLRKEHREEAVRNGILAVELGNDLANQKFATRRGLTLMGETALKGNVYLEVEADGKVLGQGLNEINTFVFSGHWTLKVNGKVYDPIFHSIDEDNVETRLDYKNANGPEQFLGTQSKPIPTGEFGATFIRISNFPRFLEIVGEIAKVRKIKKHNDRQKEAHRVFAKNVENRKVFAEVVNVAAERDKITEDEKDAFDEVYALVV
jgi:hypothetical protein